MSNHFFAGSGFPLNEDRRAGRGDLFDLGSDFDHQSRTSDKAVKAVGCTGFALFESFVLRDKFNVFLFQAPIPNGSFQE